MYFDFNVIKTFLLSISELLCKVGKLGLTVCGPNNGLVYLYIQLSVFTYVQVVGMVLNFCPTV